MRCGEVVVSLKVSDSLFFPTLDLSVTPEYSQLSNEIYSIFDDWINSIKPPVWQLIWRKLRGFHWIILAFPMFIIVMSLTINYYDYRDTVVEKAQTILNDGVSEDELTEALEILLSLEIDYKPKNYGIGDKSNHTYLIIILIFVLLLAIIWQFPPKVYLGIGRGSIVVRRWQNYIRFVFYTIPGLLITSVLPWLITLL